MPAWFASVEVAVQWLSSQNHLWMVCLSIKCCSRCIWVCHLLLHQVFVLYFFHLLFFAAAVWRPPNNARSNQKLKKYCLNENWVFLRPSPLVWTIYGNFGQVGADPDRFFDCGPNLWAICQGSYQTSSKQWLNREMIHMCQSNFLGSASSLHWNGWCMG